ncbi:alpha/beta hydrolase [Virgibacillus sp. C22-A2]|uniref:Alpha/beta hydrolase n=1 Tax=Virgibacillus tibetensis TaxID=3042313 RepID=A0ABU6KLG6_9BACI|nr:alpha/beta hydrolase [Virgibacillus sp. C22-A2]
MNNISRFLTVNNNKLEVHKIGNKGRPIIILTGMGCSFYEWYDVAESFGKSNRVILFHRPGLGLSEISSEVRNTKTAVNELNDIILQLELTEPVFLVGHSYGGLCVQHFAKEHPEKVAGIILVDSTSVDLKELDDLDLPILDEDETDEIWMEKCHSYSLMEQKELKKILNPSLTEKQKQLPLNIQQRLIDFQVNPFMYRAMYSEISNWKKDADNIKNLGKFPDVPLIVIGRDKEYNVRLGTMDGLPEWELKLLEEKWQELIMKQANLSKNSELIFATESSHSIYTDRPDVIIEAINKILKITYK